MVFSIFSGVCDAFNEAFWKHLRVYDKLPSPFRTYSVHYVPLTWRIVEPKVVRNQGEEPVRDVMKLDLGLRLLPHHVQSLGQDLVGRLDLFPAQLAQGHLLRVDLKLYHRFLHLLNVENQGDQLLNGLVKL